MDIRTVNKLVACAPFAKTSAEVVAHKGVASIDTKRRLHGTKAVARYVSPDGFFVDPGDTVYVRGDSFGSNTWVTAVFQDDSLGEFILVPFDQVVIVRRAEKE